LDFLDAEEEEPPREIMAALTLPLPFYFLFFITYYVLFYRLI
jgi:hypothetical protein